jgi:phosphopantetheine--protein transferase-like protein
MVGIDLVHIPEFQKQLELGGTTFMHKAFSSTELKDQRPDHLAGLWAAKEAVVKAGALAPGSWIAIHISHDPTGRPHARVGSQDYDISIAHHGEYAVAVAQKVNDA